MWTTYDRHLAGSYLTVWCICFASVMGLFVTIDLFDNFDEFQSRSAAGESFGLLVKIAGYYGFQAVFIFDRVGIAVGVVSVVVVLLWLQRRSELPVLLAAGVSTWRVALPLLAAGLPVIALHALNRELILPRCAHEKYESRGESGATRHRVQALYDDASLILIDGRTISPRISMLDQPRFVLPPGTVAEEPVTVTATRAFRQAATGDRPAGWRLEDCQPRFDELRLASAGGQVVLPAAHPQEMLIASAVTCDMLYRRDSGGVQHSTAELLRRIRHPVFRRLFGRKLGLEVHRRLTEPLLSLIAALVAVPLIVRRESRALSANVIRCALVLIALFATTECFYSLGGYGFLPIDLAAWLPVVISGSVAAWSSSTIQT